MEILRKKINLHPISRQIDAGIKDNIDVSIYAKPEFLAIQMHEIRIGLVERDTGLLLCGQPV